MNSGDLRELGLAAGQLAVQQLVLLLDGTEPAELIATSRDSAEAPFELVAFASFDIAVAYCTDAERYECALVRRDGDELAVMLPSPRDGVVWEAAAELHYEVSGMVVKTTLIAVQDDDTRVIDVDAFMNALFQGISLHPRNKTLQIGALGDFAKRN